MSKSRTLIGHHGPERQDDFPPGGEEPEVELSIIMPCLNEAETLGACVEKARRSLRALSVTGEIIVADNGSTDSSPRPPIWGARGARLCSHPDVYPASPLKTFQR